MSCVARPPARTPPLALSPPQALAAFAGHALLNTDDHPVVAYLAPRVTYAPDSTPADRLLALLDLVWTDPRDVVPRATAPQQRRLAAYWQARDRFIAAGRDVRPSHDAQTMLAQVREPLLAVLRLSPHFRPAREPLLEMARAVARSDPQAASGLLADLARLQPAGGP